jgi:hypothetical protein
MTGPPHVLPAAADRLVLRGSLGSTWHRPGQPRGLFLYGGKIMISLTPDEKRLRDHLANRAARAHVLKSPQVTYGTLSTDLDPDRSIGWSWSDPQSMGAAYDRIQAALCHVAEYEAEHGRPLVVALAVGEDGMLPAKFAALARRLGRLAEKDPDANPVADFLYAGAQFAEAEVDASVRYWSAEKAKANTARASLPDDQFGAIMGELGEIKQMLRQLLGS